MSKDYKEATLTNLNQGAVTELFAEEWKRLLADIADGNKPASAARSLSIKVTVEPDATRAQALTKVGITLSLPAKKDHESVILLDGDGHGGVTAYTSNAVEEELPGIREMAKPEVTHV